ncbi:FAD/NAD(P)-binding protein [Actinophytocola sediminis]
MRLALIGGGAAAVSTLVSLLDTAGEDLRSPEIDIYEPAKLGHGSAFGPDLDCALANLPNSDMTAHPGQRDHYLRWLRARHPSATSHDDHALATDFSPRRLFGAYLNDQLTTARAEAACRGWTVRVHSQAVRDLTDGTGHQLAVTTATAVREYSHVVVAIGSGEPADPYRLAGSPNFVADPYPLSTTVPDIPAREPVVVVGTGLTAVDVTMALLTHGHQGPIVLASRHGILPEVRAAQFTRDLDQFTAERVGARLARDPALRVGEIWRILEAELRSADADPDAATAWFRTPVRAREHLRHQLTDPLANLVQSIFMKVPLELARTIRAALPSAELSQLTLHKRRLKSLQCPMPARTARTLLHAMDSGQLQVVPGLSAVRHEHGRFRVLAARDVPAARYLVDATRLAPGSTRGPARPLIAALSARFGSWDSFGGLRTDLASARVRRPDGTHDPRLFAIGELTAGDIYFASSLPAVNRGAHAVAASLVAQAGAAEKRVS